MIVTAALSWYDELPETLERCVVGVANVADRIVALDGAYSRFPGGRPQSPPRQARVIRETAKRCGLEALVLAPDRLWAGQVEKRSYLLSVATVNADWICVVDADHVVNADRTVARQALEQANGTDAFDVPLFTPANPDRPIEQSAGGQWHAQHSGQTVPIPHLYRAYPGFRVERYHWWYSAVKGNQRVWMWGGDNVTYPVAPHAMLPDPSYRVDHVCLLRDKAHVLANRAFCNDREMVVQMTGQEDDRDDLPRPVFDYERMGR